MIVFSGDYGALCDLFAAVNYNRDRLTEKPLPILALNLDGKFDFLKNAELNTPNLQFYASVDQLVDELRQFSLK